MSNFSYINNAEPAYIESLYQEFKSNGNSVDEEWQKFFEGFDYAVASHYPQQDISTEYLLKELKVYRLIEAYRTRGHLISKTNPIRERKDRHARLELEVLGLEESDLELNFYAGKVIGLQDAKLKNIVERLNKIYCASIGIEFGYINNVEIRDWVLEKFEEGSDKIVYPLEKQKQILKKLNDSAVFEKFLGTKYVGQKRFSLEGGESTIPALDAIVNRGAELGLEEMVIGMAHRGRLNVLANIMGKTYEQIFSEFEGNTPKGTTMGDGDVKYHLGFSSLIKTNSGNKINLKLSPNPSHLEAVNSVVEGFVRAKADSIYKLDYNKILPVLIHGDAAIAGQGVVYEVLQMSKLEGYYTGGTIHFVINNQIGFTTDFDDARSSHYCTSLAAMVEAPVIHVNGDDVEAVVWAVEFATEYRQKFHQDIFVDMVCYRLHGHNEGDDPKFTQPELYKKIKGHENPREIYIKKLNESGKEGEELAGKMNDEFWQMLQDRLDLVKEKELPYKYQQPELEWKKLKASKPSDYSADSPNTGVSSSKLAKIVKGLISTPEGFNALPKVKRMLEERRKLMRESKTIDWAAAELLAYGSILLEGKNVRMSGQDVKRGTFSHRHAILTDFQTGEEYNRLNHLDKNQGEFRIYNSLLSEFAVLGFEFGYAMADPHNLVIWEAQFGDFVNGAQTMIDQFITASESKWRRMSGLVMLLPHGYEGQGPEHSSARLERFLQSCAEFNMSVVNITAPSNFFHVLRRQLARPYRKPLVVMSPKKLLRYPKCISPISEITNGNFKEVLDDRSAKKPTSIKIAIFCSGKIYYDLLEKKEKDKRDDVAIIRLEQLYPAPYIAVDKLIAKYKNAKVRWVQEEPENMGAWTFILAKFRHVNWELVSRKSSASPATGFKSVHDKEQEVIVEQAFEL